MTSTISSPVSEIFQRLRELPASVAVIQQALAALDDPLCTNGRLEEVLVDDPGATAGLLKLANSALFGVRAEIRTLATAARVVGRRRLSVLLRHLLAGKLLERFTHEHPRARVCRDRALAAAVVSAELAARNSQDDVDELRIAGLLHNIGEVALLAESPTKYEEARAWDAAAGDDSGSRAVFGVSFPEASAILLEGWNFPSIYVEGARAWRTGIAASRGPEVTRFVAVVHVAGVFAEQWAERRRPADPAETVSPALLKLVGLAAPDAGGLYAAIPDGVEDLRRHL